MMSPRSVIGDIGEPLLSRNPLFSPSTSRTLSIFTQNESKSASPTAHAELDLSSSPISHDFASSPTHIKINIRPIEADEEKVKSLHNRYKKKLKQKKNCECLGKCNCRFALSSLIGLTFGGLAFSMVWEFYYPYSNRQLDTLWQEHDKTFLEYNATSCPQGSYWYHPTIQIKCKPANDFSRNRNLLTQEDYCLESGCSSAFADQLKESLLPRVCVAIMNHLCDVIGDIRTKNNEKIWIYFALFVFPLVIALLGTCSFERIFRYISSISETEYQTTNNLLIDHGLSPTDVGDLPNLVPKLETLIDRKQRKAESLKQLGINFNRIDPNINLKDIFTIILQYAQLDLAPLDERIQRKIVCLKELGINFNQIEPNIKQNIFTIILQYAELDSALHDEQKVNQLSLTSNNSDAVNSGDVLNINDAINSDDVLNNSDATTPVKPAPHLLKFFQPEKSELSSPSSSTSSLERRSPTQRFSAND